MAGLGGHPRSKDYINTGLKFQKNILNAILHYELFEKHLKFLIIHLKEKFPLQKYSRDTPIPDVAQYPLLIVSSVEEILIMY